MKDRSHEIWPLLLALMVGTSVAMFLITYWNYSILAGIFYGFLASLPFGIASRLVHVYGKTITKKIEDFESRTRYRPISRFEKCLILTSSIFIVIAFFFSAFPEFSTQMVRCLQDAYTMLGVSSFLDGFVQWVRGLTLMDFLLIFWPLIVIDFVRSVGKSLFLLAHALYKKLNPPSFNPDFFPKLSLIIPAHNEERIIARSIESALETNYGNKEIIVVDDGSRDRTYDLALPYSRRGLIKLVRREVASGSKAGALNYALAFASGEIIVTVDADTLIERNSLKGLVKPLSDQNVSAVSGNVRILGGENGVNNLLVKLQAYEYLLSLELGRRFSSIIGTLLIISGAFGAFWKQYVKSLGEYDKDTTTEDFDITFKMRKMGKRLIFADKAVSWTFAPETWKAWRRQRIRWTRGQVETLWKHRNLFRMKGFDLKFVAAIYDMLFVDVVILFIRFIWFFLLIFFYQSTFLYIVILSFLLYLAMEFVSIVTAGTLSPRKEDLKYAYLTPIVVLFYRPYYSLVRLKAYLDWMFRRKSRW